MVQECSRVGSVAVYQLLAGRDFALDGSTISAQLAAQMGNYVYLLVDTNTHTAYAIDGCYDVEGLVNFAASVGATLSGGYYTHKHPDHVGGRFGKYLIEGVKEMAALADMGTLGIHADDLTSTARQCN
eukprot:gene15249-6063_t